MNTKNILINIAQATYTKRVRLQNMAIAHATAQCSEQNYFIDNDCYKGFNATGVAIENAIQLGIKSMCKTDYIPDFISYDNDPRGIVLKIKADKLTKVEKEMCEMLLGFSKDWGGDYSFIKQKELKPFKVNIKAIRMNYTMQNRWLILQVQNTMNVC